MKTQFFGRSDPGRRREVNQDAFAVSDDGAFGILADGMGGHSSGEVASRMAVELLGERLRRSLPRPSERRRWTAESLERIKGALPDLLREWLQEANAAIHKRGAAEPGVAHGRNMGTTLALLCVLEDAAIVAHVGDSRIYRLRDGKISALTRDHSVTGPVAGEPRGSGRKRKYVTRALGTKPEVEADVLTVDVRPGDRFVLCSDGLTDLVRDDEIAEILRDRGGRELANAPRALINLANERGGRDNITVVVAAVEAAPVPAPGTFAVPASVPLPELDGVSAPVGGASPAAVAGVVPVSVPLAELDGILPAGESAPASRSPPPAPASGVATAPTVIAPAAARAPAARAPAAGAPAEMADAYVAPPPLDPPPPWESRDPE